MAAPRKLDLPVQITAAPDVELLGEDAVLHPSGYVEGDSHKQQQQQHEAREHHLLKHVASFRSSPLEFLREVALHVSGSGWRAYDDVVGQPIFYHGFSNDMMAAALSSPMLQDRIRDLAQQACLAEMRQGLMDPNHEHHAARKDQRIANLTFSLTQHVEKLLGDMMCKMDSKTFIRGAAYLATQLLTRAYHQGIHVSSEEILHLRTVAEEARKNKHSLIMLPCHRSHIDYVSLQVIFYRLGLALPTVVAGDNLNFPVVGSFLQHAGAMYIRRSFADDQLYSTVVQTYIDTLLQKGHNLECFIEGGRSRTGKLLPPKFGILGFIAEALLSGRVRDAIICPVSTQYDKVIETEGYIGELLGLPKRKENLSDFLSATSVLSLRLGRIDVRFGRPWSLRQFLDKYHGSLAEASHSTSQASPDASKARIKLLRTLGYKVLSDIDAVSVVMPTALIGTVLLTLRGRGVGQSELIRRMDWLTMQIKKRGGRVAHFGGASTAEVALRGLEVLGKELVGVVSDAAEPTYYAVDRFQLSFYRNMTIHLFVAEAILSASMYTRIKQGGGPSLQRIPYEDLMEQTAFLSRLFRGEFIFPLDGLKSNLEHTIKVLEDDGIIETRRDRDHRVTEVGLSDTERQAGRENFDFHCFLIWPFIESMWLGAVSLISLTPRARSSEVWVSKGDCQTSAQLLGKTLYHQGDLSYFEAVNKATLANAYARFESEGILISGKPDAARPQASWRLAPAWVPRRADDGQIVASGALWDYTEKIARSRREGKNRRDGATVSTRVLTLADRLGEALHAAVATSSSVDMAFTKPGTAKARL